MLVMHRSHIKCIWLAGANYNLAFRCQAATTGNHSGCWPLLYNLNHITGFFLGLFSVVLRHATFFSSQYYSSGTIIVVDCVDIINNLCFVLARGRHTYNNVRTTPHLV